MEVSLMASLSGLRRWVGRPEVKSPRKVSGQITINRIGISLLINLTALALSVDAAWGQGEEQAKNDQAQLQGEWVMVSGQRDAQSFPADLRASFKRVAKGDETTVTMGGQLFLKAKFVLDPSKKPKTIGYSVAGGPYAGNTQLGIYEFDGDQIRFCFSTPGKARPTEFTTKKNDGRTLSLWKRATK
jgi:uncharacterized protein (TIGR03067 family)